METNFFSMPRMGGKLMDLKLQPEGLRLDIEKSFLGTVG